MCLYYNEDDLLLLSGIQHFAYCERQWGLIHIESLWEENRSTAEGRILHQRVDDPLFNETRRNVKIARSVPLVSMSLGLYGIADVIELQLNDNENEKKGENYSIIEYKRGKPKNDDRDEVQLCAQAICLEEMLGVSLTKGHIYYGETKHRNQVLFDEEIRIRVKMLADRMHLLFEKGVTPRAKKDKKCKNCSLSGICLPVLGKTSKRINTYMSNIFEDMKN